MGLYIRNLSNLPVDVALAYYDSGCRSEGGVPWRKSGWFNVAAGSTRQLVSGYVGGSTYYIYAENENYSWGGDFYTQVPDNRFSWCWNTGCTTCTNVGFGKVSIGLFIFNYTIEISSNNTIRFISTRIKSPDKLKKRYRVRKLIAIPGKRKFKRLSK